MLDIDITGKAADRMRRDTQILGRKIFTMEIMSGVLNSLIGILDMMSMARKGQEGVMGLWQENRQFIRNELQQSLPSYHRFSGYHKL